MDLDGKDAFDAVLDRLLDTHAEKVREQGKLEQLGSQHRLLKSDYAVLARDNDRLKDAIADLKNRLPPLGVAAPPPEKKPNDDEIKF
jgi:hypothetical protein